jgi:hypothetical protein
MLKGNSFSDASGMSKQRTLLFHIGHHKTGSTTIQNALATGRVAVKGKTILYPCAMAHNYLRKQFDNYLASGKLPKGDARFPNLYEISQRLQNESFDVAVLSGEEFEEAKPDDVQKVLAKLMLPHVTDHKVICYVRPHAGRIMSSYAEQIKIGLEMGNPEAFFEKCRASGRFHYHTKLVKWAATFGEYFKLRPLIRSELAGGSVLQDFIETGLGADFPASISDAETANESLCLEDLLLIKLVQVALATRDFKLRHDMGWQIAPALAAAARPAGAGTQLMLHKALAERIRITYREDALNIDRQFFHGKPLLRTELDRAVDEALPEEQSLEPRDHFSPETLRAVSVLCDQINQLLDHQAGSWHDFLIERRIARLHGKTAEAIKPKAEMHRTEGLPRAYNAYDHRGQATETPSARQSLQDAPIIPAATPAMVRNTPLNRYFEALKPPQNHASEEIPKIIWMFWHSGFEDVPDVVRKSLLTWRHFNPDHEIRELSLKDANALLDLDLDAVFSKLSVYLGWAGKSDLIRLLILAKYGGVWVDATTFCLKPLSEWLYVETSENGFFSFRDVSDERDVELVSWFIAAAPNQPVIFQTLLDCVFYLFQDRARKLPVTGYSEYRNRYGIKDGECPGREFLLECDLKHGNYPYFWMFYIFRDAIRDFPGQREIWIGQSNQFSQGKHNMQRFARSFVSKQTYKGHYQQSQFYLDRVAAIFDGDRIRGE